MTPHPSPLLCLCLQELGAEFQAGEPWQCHVVRDGRLVTGQNPASASAAAQGCLDAMAAA